MSRGHSPNCGPLGLPAGPSPHAGNLGMPTSSRPPKHVPEATTSALSRSERRSALGTLRPRRGPVPRTPRPRRALGRPRLRPRAGGQERRRVLQRSPLACARADTALRREHFPDVEHSSSEGCPPIEGSRAGPLLAVTVIGHGRTNASLADLISSSARGLGEPGSHARGARTAQIDLRLQSVAGHTLLTDRRRASAGSVCHARSHPWLLESCGS